MRNGIVAVTLAALACTARAEPSGTRTDVEVSCCGQPGCTLPCPAPPPAPPADSGPPAPEPDPAPPDESCAEWCLGQGYPYGAADTREVGRRHAVDILRCTCARWGAL